MLLKGIAKGGLPGLECVIALRDALRHAWGGALGDDLLREGGVKVLVEAASDAGWGRGECVWALRELLEVMSL